MKGKMTKCTNKKQQPAETLNWCEQDLRQRDTNNTQTHAVHTHAAHTHSLGTHTNITGTHAEKQLKIASWIKTENRWHCKSKSKSCTAHAHTHTPVHTHTAVPRQVCLEHSWKSRRYTVEKLGPSWTLAYGVLAAFTLAINLPGDLLGN